MSKVQIIINPASGMGHPVLRTLNKAFGNDVEWDVSVTHKRGDAHRFAEAAVAAGADIIAVYGGDGTVTEVANVLAGGDVPLAILPGGTGNAVARMLGIPMELEQSAALLRQNHQLRTIDLGHINKHTFMLRADIGFMAVIGAEPPPAGKRSTWKIGLCHFRCSASRSAKAYSLPHDTRWRSGRSTGSHVHDCQYQCCGFRTKALGKGDFTRRRPA